MVSRSRWSTSSLASRGCRRAPSAASTYTRTAPAPTRARPSSAEPGGHYDPGPQGQSTPVDNNHPYHTGDLPNLEVDHRGVGELRTRTSRFVLQPNHRTSIDDRTGGVNSGTPGAAVIVHAMEDEGGEASIPGAPGRSQYAGGSRAACGILEFDDGPGPDGAPPGPADE
ncbi:MAG: superoxide dismutase family protein [Thermoleophilaceae bacterium]|nr:superoxide dismutase family protein [Thermoleophilaceae bacterium]